MNQRIGFQDLKAPLLALGISLGLATILLPLLGASPGKALFSFYFGPFTQVYFWGNLLNQAALLTLTGLGVALAFRAGSFNLGGEGQTYLGGLGAAALGLSLSPDLGFWGIPLILLAGAFSGFLPALGSGILKKHWGVDDLITTFLISAALLPLVDGLIGNPWMKDAHSYLIRSRVLDPAFSLPVLAPPSNLHWGTLLIFPLILIIFLGLFYTPWGYRFRMTGQNRLFAKYSGIETRGFDLWPLGFSGALHGLAGALAVLGVHHAMIQSFSFGLGWNGISVALMARNHPLLILPAALILSWLDQGSRAAVIQAQFPFELGALLQAVILLFITSNFFKGRKG